MHKIISIDSIVRLHRFPDASLRSVVSCSEFPRFETISSHPPTSRGPSLKVYGDISNALPARSRVNGIDYRIPVNASVHDVTAPVGVAISTGSATGAAPSRRLPTLVEGQFYIYSFGLFFSFIIRLSELYCQLFVVAWFPPLPYTIFVQVMATTSPTSRADEVQNVSHKGGFTLRPQQQLTIFVPGNLTWDC